MLPEPQLGDDALWKRRFRAPTIRDFQIARRNPERALVVSNESGIYQLYAWDAATGGLRQLTDKPEGMALGSISPDGEHVYYIRDTHGNEVGHWVRVPFSGGPPEDISPDLPEYSSWGLSFGGDCKQITFLAVSDNIFSVYSAPLAPGAGVGEPVLIHRSPAFLADPLLSYGAEICVIASTERAGKLQFSLLAFDRSNGSQIAELYDGPDTSITPVAFSPVEGDFRLLAGSDRSGYDRPLIWNPRTGERVDFDLGDVAGDVVPLDWSPDGTRVLLCRFHLAVQQLYVYDLSSRKLERLDHPNGTISASFASPDELVAHWQDSEHAPRIIALDASTGRQTRGLLCPDGAPSGHPWRSITFTSSDGQEIQAWLGVPDGDGPFPTVLETHGGPEAVATDTYAPRAHLWLDHGFAFLTVNYRGSTTFGREFKEKIWGNPGYWEIEDMAAGHRWMVDNGIARADAVFVTGWSYGGYNTLQAIGLKPDLWAGGMAGVAVADWISQFEDESDSMRGIDVPFMGGRPDEAPEVYRAASPLTYCEQVKAPVVIIQGHNDTRCPPRQVAIYQARMKALGKPCEVHWFDAGHMVGPVEQAIEHQEIFLRFVYSIL